MKQIQIVLFAIHEKNLDLTITSLLSQSLNKESTRIIVVDVIGTDAVRDKYRKLENAFEYSYIDAEGLISTGLAKAAAIMDEVPFMLCLAGTKYSPNSINAMSEKIFEGSGIVSVHPYLLSHLSSRLAEAMVDRETDFLKIQLNEGKVRYDEHMESMHLSMDSYMFSGEFVKCIREYKAADEDCLKYLLLDMLSRSDGYYYLEHEKSVLCSPQQIANPDYAAMKEQWWYTKCLDESYVPFISKMKAEGRLSCAMQYSLTALIIMKFRANYEEKNLGVIVGKECIHDFYKAAGRALKHIRNDVFIKWCSDNRWDGRGQDKKVRFHRAVAFKILEFKAEQCGGKAEVTTDGHNFYVATPGEEPTLVCQADQETLDITVINYENGKLAIDAVFTAGDVVGEAYELWAECNGKRITAERSTVYPLIKCFGETAARRHHVKFVLDAHPGTIVNFFYCAVDKSKHEAKLTFNTAFSRLVTGQNSAYWIFTKGRYLSCRDSKTLLVKKMNPVKHIGKEIKSLFSMLSYQCPGKVMMLGSIAVRCLYWVTKPFYGKKKRWVTFDKLYKGGDNGEYFFRYSAERKDNVRVYYIVNKETREYRELKKKYRYVLKAISLRTVLTVLNSEAIAATHSTVVSYLGIPLSSRPFLRDLFNFKVCCIQHGLTVQQLAQYQNRTFDNTTLYCLASPYEYNNLMKPMYDFEEKHLKMTGLARFDGLKNDDKRYILITPTWRRNVVASGIANIKKAHAEGFKSTEYYRLYNGLINDEKLIECAKRCGYGITYLLHPAMSAQIDDYDKNDYVKLVPATGDMNYERVLTQASLMVTDYSGVQFDFAYMRKPIVYYHPSTLPPQYESGSIDYETTGFGPICTQHDRLIDCLCEYMENNCRNTETYIERADAFFAFSDYESCRRIYDEMLAFTEHKE